MKKMWALCALLTSVYCKSLCALSIVFVHIGDTLPIYLDDAIEQVRMFNPDASVYLCGNRCALNKLPRDSVIEVSIEDLDSSIDHKYFLKGREKSPHFWRSTTERFFVLQELAKQYMLEDIIHLENDNMVYVNFEELMTQFSTYPDVGTTFDSEKRCIPGLVYFKDAAALDSYGQFITSLDKKYNRKIPNDMYLLGLYKKEFPRRVTALPVVPVEYTRDKRMVNRLNKPVRDRSLFSRNADAFGSLFDAAAIGQYLGGCDPIHRVNAPGFVNPDAVYKSDDFSYLWERDDLGRLIPYLVYAGKKWRMNNLHIHSKRLHAFRSDRSSK